MNRKEQWVQKNEQRISNRIAWLVKGYTETHIFQKFTMFWFDIQEQQEDQYWSSWKGKMKP